MGKQVTVTSSRYVDSSPQSFTATALWVIPTMVLLMIAGFMLGGVFVGKYMEKGDVNVNKRTPVRILTPSEAQLAAKDQPSRVWTDGVDRSTLPKMDSTTSSERKTTPKKPAAKPNAPTARPAANPTGVTDSPPNDGGSASDDPPDAGGNETIPPD